MKEWFLAFMAWAEPGYRFACETAAEAAVLVLRGVLWVLRVLLAVILFPVWGAVRLVGRLRTGRKGGGT